MREYISFGNMGEFSEYLRERYERVYDREFIEGFFAPIRPAIRVNDLRVGEDELLARLVGKGFSLEKIPWAKGGYFVNSAPFSIGATPEYLLGYYFIQDPTSMYACEALDPRSGEVVLDMAAAPGGKTTYMAQLMKNEGTIVAIELNRERMKSLRSNITRMGVMNTIAIRMNSLEAEKLNTHFDKILLDAPCTGTGTLNKNPEAALKEEKDTSTCTALQRDLLAVAAKILKQGGSLVYSACSFLPEEGELILQGAVENLGLKLEEVEQGEDAFTECYGKKLKSEMKKAKRFYPHLHGTQGFFIGKLSKA